MGQRELCERTKQFALRVIRLYSALPKSSLAQTLGKQVLRSGTSVAANYREASRARSNAEMIAKLGIVEQELDETMLWMELLVESKVVSSRKMAAILNETEELLKIIVASIRTLRRKKS